VANQDQVVTMRYRKLHPVTSDMRREISVAALAKAGGFRQPMKFPFQQSRNRVGPYLRFPRWRQKPPDAADHRRDMAADDVRHEAVFYLPTMQRKALFPLSRWSILLL